MMFPAVKFTSLGRLDMKHIYRLVALLLLLAPAVLAQEHYTEGPVWRVTLVRVKPGQMDAYLTSLQQSTKPLLDEQKKQGMIVEYKNHAAMDGLAAKGEAIRDKILGGKQQGQQLTEKRLEMRETVSSELIEEIYLK